MDIILERFPYRYVQDGTLEINGKNVKFTITAIEKITASTPKTSRDSIL